MNIPKPTCPEAMCLQMTRQLAFRRDVTSLLIFHFSCTAPPSTSCLATFHRRLCLGHGTRERLRLSCNRGPWSLEALFLEITILFVQYPFSDRNCEGTKLRLEPCKVAVSACLLSFSMVLPWAIEVTSFPDFSCRPPELHRRAVKRQT